MGSIELWDNLIQLAVSGISSLWALWLYRKGHARHFSFLCGALMCWSLGLMYWLLYYMLRGYSPPEPSPANFAWSGSHLFLISVALSMASDEERAWHPPLALLAPALTLPFTYTWFSLGEVTSPTINLLWGLGFAVLSYVSLRGLMYAHRQRDRRRMLYHALVLALVLFNEMMLHISLFLWPEDYLHFNGYYAFDMLVTLMLALLTPALIRAAAERPVNIARA